eukprot:m.220947 g.220947  ORF g.220947 m.220947 type:complete len:545 (+) comp19177_c0_seq1:169-1803(+)
MASLPSAGLIDSDYIDPPPPSVTVRGKMVTEKSAIPTSIACCLVDLLRNCSRAGGSELPPPTIDGSVISDDVQKGSNCVELKRVQSHSDNSTSVPDAALHVVHVDQACTNIAKEHGRRYLRRRTACGTVLVRMNTSGDYEALVIARRDRSEYELPKGKLRPHETTGEAALRKLIEEAGLVSQSAVDVAIGDVVGVHTYTKLPRASSTSATGDSATHQEKQVLYFIGTLNTPGHDLQFDNSARDTGTTQVRWVGRADALTLPFRHRNIQQAVLDALDRARGLVVNKLPLVYWHDNFDSETRQYSVGLSCANAQMPSSAASAIGIPMLHATHCPQRQFASDMICKIAAIVVVRSADGHVLLTRRAPHMRTFPNVWVVPGGGVDAGEGIMDAAVREVAEETGVDISTSTRRLMAAFESCFPPHPNQGVPVRHHLIAIVVADLPLPHCDIAVTVQESEVSCAGWLAPAHVRAILQTQRTAAEAECDAIIAANPELATFPGTAVGERHRLAPLLSGHLHTELTDLCAERLGTSSYTALDELSRLPGSTW